ncbi:STAS domain-containing protein [Pelagicoccus sp. SDUM812003]|uniref:STAS domain-containing protein n=1 Tax=Pelagicoccus sp. SDUM812003 TaxID=3041267 RepID=UPI00280FFC00|nr:STAS domain-containing protein [Pelagicoccus sp. SDUM812003]MDQ8203993.1 STAS domain-containing protein [Pelagicoccus sp. SDUM812003]
MKQVAELLSKDVSGILEKWIALQENGGGVGRNAISRDELVSQSNDFLKLFAEAVASGKSEIEDEAWDETLMMLREVAMYRSQRGLKPKETATFVLSLKEALFERALSQKSSSKLLEQLWSVTTCVDKLGLYVMELFIEKREDVIERQREELLEVSTPVVELWTGILALPVIGTLDSARAQAVMEALLQAIVDYEAKIAIIDITGVPAVDTQTAQHLLKSVRAAELMGAQCYISGVRPQIAQTIVQLGLDLGGMQTKGSLMSAFRQSLTQLGMKVAENSSSNG